ncbi:hypothetical protein NDU88_006993 [Pleurodeles waltl]|uniref:Uncharacterized protein n=1 Tax=Pleurodeles waltl TaxID=8319 RepID=A0AAV7RPL4_PLEWA|nr:hypothetical protein NDU88_006993 [Pleurodeles waltl]
MRDVLCCHQPSSLTWGLRTPEANETRWRARNLQRTQSALGAPAMRDVLCCCHQPSSLNWGLRGPEANETRGRGQKSTTHSKRTWSSRNAGPFVLLPPAKQPEPGTPCPRGQRNHGVGPKIYNTLKAHLELPRRGTFCVVGTSQAA